VGSRTRRPQHRLQATHIHQVVGTSRLHGRVRGRITYLLQPSAQSNG
jgi:hypothetical protein